MLKSLCQEPEANAAPGRRKALKSKNDAEADDPTAPTVCADNEKSAVPHWIESEQRVLFLADTAAQKCGSRRSALIPSNKSTAVTLGRNGIVFPLSSDHLIVLLQYNALRANITNRLLVSCLKSNPQNECSEAALHVSPVVPYPTILPPSLHPTALQQTIPHEEWVDIIPHPAWRDNVLQALGQFDEDQLWADTMGGLFEGFPDSEIQSRGVVAWWPPWDASGWEVSEGFLRRWRWMFNGCENLIEATNKWRALRGEEPLLLGPSIALSDSQIKRTSSLR